jgi:hypothetical protein
LQVTQHDQQDLINRIYSEEKYGRNVGLIYKRVIDIESQPIGIPDSLLSHFYGTPIMNRITSGFQYTMTITSYGTE